jgi:redox-sensitive bicupin YhaK (pirin superfamily)
VRHSEYNASPDELVHFFQIWIEPNTRGTAPGYEQKRFAPEELAGRLRVVASPDGREGSVAIQQDACIHAVKLDGAQSAQHDVAPGRRCWVHVARGTVNVNGHALRAGDGAACEDEARVELRDGRNAEVLVFDLP